MQKSVLITGCSSGIGYSVACGLRDHGFLVLATARKTQDVVRLRAEGFQAFKLDLENTDSISCAVDWATEQAQGRIYGLFNNGAYGQPGAVEDLSRDVLRKQFENNFFGTHELTTLVLKSMLKNGEGRIIQNSSVLGLVALPFRGAYNASKFALEGLTDTLRLELVNTGVHVSLIEPGPISTRFRDNALKAFRENIDVDNSRFRAQYEGMSQRMAKPGPVAPGTLPPEACLRPVLHALTSANPRPRYYVTWPTHFLGFSKRVLSSRAMDLLAGNKRVSG